MPSSAGNGLQLPNELAPSHPGGTGSSARSGNHSRADGAFDMDWTTTPKHPVYALTTFELNERRSALERAIREILPDAAVPEYLRSDLADVIAEQDERARIRQVNRRNDNQDHYCVRQLTTAELERAKRELQANLGLITVDSPARVPIQNHMRAIDAELAERADGHCASGVLSSPTQGRHRAGLTKGAVHIARWGDNKGASAP